MLYIRKLSSVTQNELAAAGQRALDLAQLQQNQIPAAASFVVLSTAFEEVMRTNNLKYKIDYILSHAQENIPQSLLNAYNGVRKAMLEATLPHGMETELRETYESITVPLAVGDLVAANDRVPVRIIMSTNRVDDPENNDTIIQNVNGFDELLVGIREAWALAYHPSQLGARMREKFPESRHKIALLVQSMDRSTASCHAYSCLPQDHHKVYLQVYAGYPDLREKIVKDYYAIGKENLRIIATQTGKQLSMLDRNDAKELLSVPVNGRFELIERDIAELARLTKKAERTLKTPVKAFFTITEGMPELLWVNRLGFDILIKDDAEPTTPVVAAPIVSPTPVAAAPEPVIAEPVAEPVVEPAPKADDFLLVEPASEPIAGSVAEPIAAAQTVAPAAELLIETLPAQAPDAPAVAPASPAMDVRTGVAAKLLNASLRIVRQIVERKYRGAFGETPATDNLAEMINRLNTASVFSRAVDGALLLQAEEAARNASTISEAEYAKTIEEVAYLLSYA